MSAFTADAVAETAGPDWLRARRAGAFERFRAAALPTAAEEVWRYSRIDQLDLDVFSVRAPVPATGWALPGALEPLLAAAASGAAAAGRPAALVTTCDGHLTGIEQQPGSAVEITDLASADAAASQYSELLGAVAAEGDAFGSLNLALAASPLVIRARARQRVDGPVVIVHWIASGGVTVAPRTVIQVDSQAELTVIEIIASAGEPALVVPVTEMGVADAGHLTYSTLQVLGSRSWQIGYQASEVARDATFVSSAVALGGEYARVRTDSRITGQGGSSQLSAVYFGTGQQMHDFRTLQDHDAPKSNSNLLFKGAVADQAHSVYSGLIRVRKGAAGTNALQTNRNLVLGAGAHADSVPNLEIEENEVRCNHASAVGPIDSEQRFYLESRGIPPVAADRLIVLGFLDEVLERLPAANLRAHLRGAVATKLDTVRER